MNEACRYMPHAESTLRGKAEKVFRSLSYDFWRRELKRAQRGRKRNEQFRIVDIGCGPGFLLGCLVRWFPEAELIGVDASDQLLGIAKSRSKRIKVLKGDACSLALTYASVDVLFALHIVEHLPRPVDFLGEAHRVLRPGGLLVMATPNLNGLGARLMKRRWSGYSDPTHISLNGPPFWRQMLKAAGFQVTHDGTTGLSGIPVLNRMPLALIHWAPSFFFGFYGWQLGEAYVCTALRPSH